ncbi:GNAT family N-acetyltransferase [Woeseia oceani]|uniref:N-acetyltransferase domain-containing protein n=1 Tax=Woeseia oceani TaxID=1548547 RepID=A0A193LHW0_9GAMM|nr:GNAT family N-acetyltransferase [Woeseia oceani]ANO52023.1 hypothetical protein BA177_13175 [Woeseia oceani]
MAKEAGRVVGETDRLVLRELSCADADLIHSVLNDPDFLRYVGDRGVRTAADAEAYIAERIAPGYREYGYGMYRVERKTDAVAVGICGLVRRAGLDAPDLGFAFLPAFRRQGFAAESAALVLRQARHHPDIEQVFALATPDNEPSNALLLRLGMRFDRRLTLAGNAAQLNLYVSREQSL